MATDAATNFTAPGAQVMPADGVAPAGTLIYVTALGTGAADSSYYTTAATGPTTGAYSTVADPGGNVSGVIAATTLQRNTDLASAGGIRAITSDGYVTASLLTGASGATLDNSLNAVSSTATGNTATTGIAVTGGAPTLLGGLAVLNEQVNATTGAATAPISAATNGGRVSTALGATAGTSLASSSALMEGNQVTAAATGSAATNTMTVGGLVRLGAAATPTLGNGTGSVSTGALLSQERTTYTESVAPGATLETTAYSTVAGDSSGVAPYQAAAGVADYLAANIQRNNGSATAPLAVTGTVTDGLVSVGTVADTTGTTAVSSTLGVTGNSMAASATGARATTTIGNDVATLVGDGVTMAALSLQEASSTSTRAMVSNSAIGVGAGSTAAGTATQGGVLSGGTVTVGANTVSATGVSNIATTSLNNIAASGGTLSSGATFTSALRSDLTGDNVDASYTAPLAAISAQRLTSAVTAGAETAIASASVSNADIGLALNQTIAAGSAFAATGSTLALTGNRTQAAVGGNQATVGVSFAEGSGSLLPGGAVAGNAQALAPTVTGTSIASSITGSSMQVSAMAAVGDGAEAIGTAATFVGGSVTASDNRFASQAIGNQGSGNIASSSLLIAGGLGGEGATASLNNGAASDTATASYLLANTQRAAPSTGTMAISSSVTDGTVSVVGGGNAAAVAIGGNTVTAVGAANVFTGAVTGLSSTGAATQLAVSQQDVAGVSVSSALTGAAAVYSIGGSGLTAIDATTAPAAFASGSVAVSDNTMRALSVMNEAGLSVTGAGVVDLGTTGGGRIATATLTGSAVTLSGFEAGAANQQVVSLDATGTLAARTGSYGVSSTTDARVGVNGGSGAVGFTGTTIDVAGNTVDARTLGNTAVLDTSGGVFAGGVGVVNSQAVSQGVSNSIAGLSASNTGTTVGAGTTALPPPIGTSSMSLANNTISASTAANDAQLQIASLSPGSLGNGNLSTRAASDVALSTSGGSAAFLSGVDADYLAANVQTTSNLRASSTVGGATTAGVSILAAASTVTGTTAVTGNRIAAETTGNRANASMSLPALNAGYVQTASYQANTGGNFASDVVNARVGFAASTPSPSARSTAAVGNNTILASAQGNMFNSAMLIPAAGANYAQVAAQQVNSGTTVAASVTGATVNVAGVGGMASTSLTGNTVGASAMGNVLRTTIGAR